MPSCQAGKPGSLNPAGLETSLRVSTSGGRDQPTDMARLTQGAPDQTPSQSLEAEGGPSLTGHVSNYKGNPWEMTNVFIPLGYGTPPQALAI